MHPAANKVTGTKKKKPLLAKILITILIVLLLPVLLAGALILYMNIADFQYDNPQQVISSSVPMTFSERNSFDADGKTHLIRLDNADLYYLISDKIPDLHFTDSIYINAYRLALEDNAIYIQGKAYGINIPVKVGIDAGWENGSLLVRIRNAGIGKLGIPIPLKLIAEKVGFDLEYALSLTDDPLLKTAADFYIKDGYLYAAYPVDKSIVAEGINAWTYLKPAALYQPEEDSVKKNSV